MQRFTDRPLSSYASSPAFAGRSGPFPPFLLVVPDRADARADRVRTP
ncbi:MAG: hypothetical protein ABI585_11460 [Betaproteobacteria bacterium]